MTLQSRPRALAIISLLAVTLAASPIEELAARETNKIDIAEAKAELAKAKAKAKETANEQAKPEPRVATEPTSEEKPSQWRLFKRRHKTEAPPEKEANPANPANPAAEADKENGIQVQADDTAEAEGAAGEKRKSRFRLFARKPDDSKSTTSKEEATEVEPVATEDSVEIAGDRVAVADEAAKPEAPKRFSLFRRKQQEPPTTAPVEEPEPASVADTDPPAPADSEETEPPKKLFGGLFANRRKADAAAEAADTVTAPEDTPLPVEEPAQLEEEETQSQRGGSLFGLFRRDNTKEFAKAEKTKLGNSVDSDAAAAPASGGGELGWYVVTEAKTPFYVIGPGQPMPPEKVLDRGSMLTVTKGGWGWCNVKLGTGELGVVSTKAMRPATVAEVSRHSQMGATASKSRGSSRLFNILSRGPAPKPELPTGSGSGPIRNFGLLPSIGPGD